jgi:hypothetical protein
VLKYRYSPNVPNRSSNLRLAPFLPLHLPHGVTLDVMAGIRVRTGVGFKSWEFNPRSGVMTNGLPWMRPQDWLNLYEMFDRPERVILLRIHLNGE